MLNYVKEGNHLKIRAKEKRVKDGEKKRRVGIINAWLKNEMLSVVSRGKLK